MQSSNVLENLVAGVYSKEEAKSDSDVMDLVRVVQSMNSANSVISKMDFETRRSMVLAALSGFREALQLERDRGASAVLEDESFLSQFSRGSGAAASRVLQETIPSAISMMDAIILLIKSDLDASGAFYPAAGPAAIFLGWSDSLLSFVRKVPILFSAGNGVCVKPSRASARALLAVARLWNKSLEKAGVPPGTFSVLNGRGAANGVDDETIGSLILKHPSFKNIHWIGSSDSALRARPLALDAGKRFYFFGSGRNPTIIFAPEAGIAGENWLERNLSELVHLAADPHGWGPYRPSRIFIQETVYKKALEILEARLQAVKMGDPCDILTALGPVPQASVGRFKKQLSLSLSETGKLVTGGEERMSQLADGFVPPTLVRDLTNCSTLQGEELEGVFLTAASFKYQHEAVKYANTSPLGLAGYVVHPDSQKTQGLATKLEVSRLIPHFNVDRAQVLSISAPPVKNSASTVDGLAATLEQSRFKPAFLNSVPRSI